MESDKTPDAMAQERGTSKQEFAHKIGFYRGI